MIIFLMFITFGYSQTIDLNQDKITNAERIIDKYSGKIYDLIVEMAEGLAVPAEYVWRVLVRQAIVESITCLIVLITGILLMYLFYNFLSKKVDGWEDYENMPFIYVTRPDGSIEKKTIISQMVVNIILAVLGFILFIIGMINIDIIVQGIVNPEYKAIEMVIDAINGN